jgi:hypothetical protein
MIQLAIQLPTRTYLMVSTQEEAPTVQYRKSAKMSQRKPRQLIGQNFGQDTIILTRLSRRRIPSTFLHQMEDVPYGFASRAC